jgi:hypothetical protein
VARSIPALPVIPADPRRDAPRLPILAGLGLTPEDVGHWRDLARLVNLDIATGNASVVFEQTWADGQMFVASVGFAHRFRIAIPPLSGYHTLVRCSVYGSDPAALGTVRFQGTNAASLVDIALPILDAWTDSAGPGHLAVAFAWAPSYEEITVQTDGVCNITAIKVEYLDHSPGGLWPGADDAIAAGPVPGSTNLANPMDDAEVAADSPLASDLGVNILRNLRDLEARERVYLSIAGFEPTLVVGVDSVIPVFPTRVVAPVLAERTPTVELTVAVYADGSGGAFDLEVQRRSSGQFIADVTLSIAAVGPSWRFYTVELVGGRDYEAPDEYPGMTTLAVQPALAVLTQNVRSICMWSR